MGPDANRDSTPSVLLATAKGSWELDEDAPLLTAALQAAGIGCAPAVWTDGSVRWVDADLVVVRSTWDYAPLRDEYVAWAHRVASTTTLANPADVIEWNTDKRYLAELGAAGFPVVPTMFVAPSEAAALPKKVLAASTGGELVVKPSVSAGSKDTGRFASTETERAMELAGEIAHSGRTVMIQPYVPSVDVEGETGLVYFDGAFSHAFNKGPMLERGAAPEPGPYAPERIRASRADAGQRELAGAVIAHVAQSFGAAPLHARVDMVTGADDQPMLMELELTEPSWFLSTDPASPARAASAIAARLGR